MSPPPVPATERSSILLPLATVCLVAWLAVPTLIAASGNDLYARGLPLAFLIWLAPLVHYYGLMRSTSKPHCHFWIALALLFCVLGSMSGFRILYHLSLAAAIPGFCGLRYTGILALIGASSWLPASGWFLSHFKTGGLMGWERPVAASLFSIVLVMLTLSIAKRPLSTL
jgi:hypothetical protein